MLSKNQIKLIKSLTQKKFREQHGLFTVEGVKGITEFLNSKIELQHIYTITSIFDTDESRTTVISEAELKKISQLKSPNTALAIFKIPVSKPIEDSKLIIALDAVRDPGNLGTIIRLCDWFGVKDLICSKTTVDCYNTKVVQASMGSLTRVNVSYIELEDFLKASKIEKFGTFLEGESIYESVLPEEGILILGNEANGISKTIETLVDTKLTIPRFGNLKATESLNVATATSICLSEFKRSFI
ncbi:TrmH family RNA methyltransferase [Winogradskyella immobilis]|uniref:RNA methyltransferase n=1 Tax=Winogradskyella immobilis TaxID=2816852 RepID=A0ABS8EJD7_9FLAO|nr:RNA methyltransferase [Winogradskyella immobilis]MCC1483225.1 RNA methyltransferase [Winogradskyella immobilis]MCG0015319.1 RNA methyltransferase [Winogradskyella immobilis]